MGRGAGICSCSVAVCGETGEGLGEVLFHLPSVFPVLPLACLLYASPGVSLCGCPCSGQVGLPVCLGPPFQPRRAPSLTIPAGGGHRWFLQKRARPDLMDSSSLLKQFHPFSVPPIS